MIDMTNIGLHAERLRPNQNNPREQAFVEQWHAENEHHDMLSLLFSVPCSEDDSDRVVGYGDLVLWKMPIGRPLDRDRIIVETVIQWLGSNVGLGFLQDALERVGYKLERKAPAPDIDGG